MIIRQALNFTAHLVAGVAVGVFAVAACKALKQRQRDDWTRSAEPDDGKQPVESHSGATR